MKRTSVLLILSMLTLTVASGTQQPGTTEPVPWENFLSSQGRFTFQVPTKPMATNRELDSKVGKLTLYTYTSRNRVAMFVGTFGDYPIAASDTDQAGRILDSVRNGVIRESRANLISEKGIWIKGHPGRELTGSSRVEGTDVVYTWRIFLVNRRLYQLAAATLATNANHPDITKFLDSFELIPQ